MVAALLSHHNNISMYVCMYYIWISLCSTDIFLPTPDSLLVNLNECKEVRTFTCYNSTYSYYWIFKLWGHTRDWRKTLVTLTLTALQMEEKWNEINVFPQGSIIGHTKKDSLPIYLPFSLCRIYWRACQIYLKRPWRLSLPWVQLCKRPSSCCRPPEGACLFSRPSCLTSVWGRSSPEKTPTNGHLPRWDLLYPGQASPSMSSHRLFNNNEIFFVTSGSVFGPRSLTCCVFPSGHPALIPSDRFLQEASSGLLRAAGGGWPVPAQLSVLRPGIAR